MARLSLTRRVRFAAAHRYRRPDWDDERNERVFGLCARESFHGLTYECDVTVTASLDRETGFVADLGVLDGVLQRFVLDALDHRNLNVDVPEFAEGKDIPTGENLARWIADRVQGALPAPVTVMRVVVREDPSLWATWERD
jgi:6-pyruvoyltetrahydropterin/6-carboxytetrahydropterin synthase